MLGLEATITALESTVRDLEPATLSSDAAVRLVDLAAHGEKLFGALKALAARRVADSGAWSANGDRSAAHWLARRGGTSVGQAIAALETAQRLHELPAVEAAYRNGELSAAQVNEIASAAAADPTCEVELLRAAETDGIAGLRERSRRAKAAAQTDEVARYEAIRRSRHLRHWTDPDGAFRLDGRLTPDAGAELLAGLEPYRARTFTEARAAGRREPYDAYLADALIKMARDARDGVPATDSGPRATVHVRVDEAALRRGRIEPGETCEIPGVGPIPVATARALADDAILSVLVTDGIDVTTVAHRGRTIPTSLRRALIERDVTCVVPGCHVRDGLEIDHIIAFAAGGPTSLPNLCRLCKWHHYLKTHHGYRITGRAGEWGWSPPRSRSPDPPTVRLDDAGTVAEQRARIWRAAIARLERGPAP